MGSQIPILILQIALRQDVFKPFDESGDLAAIIF